MPADEYFDSKTGLRVSVERDEEGFSVAYCPEWEGCHAQGSTLPEGLNNILQVVNAFGAIKKERGEESVAARD